jgi:hypothetical protein
MEDTAPSGGNTGGTPSAPAASAPTTFAEAFASTPADSPSAEPAAQDTTSPDTAIPGSEQAASPQQDERSPFIPRSRFDEVVTARQQAEREFAEYKQQRQWAENPHAQEFVQRIARHNGDVVGLMNELMDDIGSTPEGAAQIRSLLGRKFGGLRQPRQQEAAPALELPQPDVAIHDGHGNVVGHTFSDKALAQRDAYLEQQLLAKVEQTYGPTRKTLEQFQQERQLAQQQEHAGQFAKSFESTAKEMFPAFDVKIHGPAVIAELAKFRLPNDANQYTVEAAGLRALNKVMLPTLAGNAKSELLDSLQQKAHASTAVNPASAAPTSTSRIDSFTDSRLKW